MYSFFNNNEYFTSPNKIKAKEAYPCWQRFSQIFIFSFFHIQLA